jgi:hypothetical protein
MGKIKLIVLDVLKPHSPSLIELTSALSDLEGVDGVDSSIIEIDKEVETVKITIAGEDLSYEKMRAMIEEMGGSVHSIDKVKAGSKVIKEASIPQDKR